MSDLLGAYYLDAEKKRARRKGWCVVDWCANGGVVHRISGGCPGRGWELDRLTMEEENVG